MLLPAITDHTYNNTQAPHHKGKLLWIEPALQIEGSDEPLLLEG
jgi:hypothetical protein